MNIAMPRDIVAAPPLTAPELDWLPSHDALRHMDIAENGSVSDQQSGESYELRDTAVAILQLARDQVRMDELLEEICGGYIATPHHSPEESASEFASRAHILAKSPNH